MMKATPTPNPGVPSVGAWSHAVVRPYIAMIKPTFGSPESFTPSVTHVLLVRRAGRQPGGSALGELPW